jgi:hypothetical protein
LKFKYLTSTLHLLYSVKMVAFNVSIIRLFAAIFLVFVSPSGAFRAKFSSRGTSSRRATDQSLIPVTEKAKLTLTIAGPSIGNALFRAELKKELTFFRGMCVRRNCIS